MFKIRNVSLIVSSSINDGSTRSQRSLFFRRCLPPFINDIVTFISCCIRNRLSSFRFVFCFLFLLRSLAMCFIKLFVVVVLFCSFLTMCFVKLFVFYLSCSFVIICIVGLFVVFVALNRPFEG